MIGSLARIWTTTPGTTINLMERRRRSNSAGLSPAEMRAVLNHFRLAEPIGRLTDASRLVADRASLKFALGGGGLHTLFQANRYEVQAAINKRLIFGRKRATPIIIHHPVRQLFYFALRKADCFANLVHRWEPSD